MESSRPLKFWVEKLLPPLVQSAVRRAKIELTPAAERELPSRRLLELFPGAEQASANLKASEFERPPGTLPISELLTLAAITSHVRPSQVFEIGTFRGASTVLLARHAPDTAQIHTLDLPLDSAETRFAIENGNITGVPFTVGEYYLGSPHAAKVKQLFGDSATFDFSPYHRRMELVFVDGNHEYENVKVDSRNAFDLLAPGGTIVWDDYHPDFGAGVMRALHELRDRGLYRIANTRFVVYRDRAA